MKSAVAIAAFAAVAAAQGASNSSTTSATPSRTGLFSSSTTGGSSGIPYPTVTAITPTQTELSELTKLAEDLLSDVSTFMTSLTAQPAYSQFTAAVGSVAAKSETAALLGTGGFLDKTSMIESLATATPTWWTKLPTSAQAYYTSVVAAEVSIVSSDFQGPAAPTAAPMMKAAGVAAAGALAGAALLL